MKNLFLIFISFTFFFTGKTQSIDTIPKDGFSFSIKSKFLLKLVENGKGTFKYYVLKSERFDTIVDTYENSKYFSNKVEKNTIEVIFCLGTFGETEKEKKDNLKTLLILKSGVKVPLDYKADIQRPYKDEFRPTSVEPLFPNVKSMEMWPYLIDEIALHDFKILKN